MKPASQIDADEAQAVVDEGNSSAIDIRATLPLCDQWAHVFVGYVGGAACVLCGHTVAHRGAR